MGSMLRRVSPGVIAVLIAAATVPAAAAEPPADPGGSTPSEAAETGRTDSDGNGIADGLEADLAAMAPAEEVEVIVMADSPVAKARAEGRLGPFQIVAELPIIDGFVATANAAQISGLARVPGVSRVQANGQVSISNDSAQRDHGTAEYLPRRRRQPVCAPARLPPASSRQKGRRRGAVHPDQLLFRHARLRAFHGQSPRAWRA